MGITPEPNFHGRRLIRELRSLRLRTGMNQHEAGARAHIDLQKLSRMETRQLPTYHELCTMLDIYGVLSSDWAPYLELWDLARRPPWWRQFGVKDPRYLRMEDEAILLYEFRLGHVPELLQTPEYARAMHARLGDPAAGTHVEVLLRRQQRVLDGRLAVYALIHEPVLYQGVDRDQLIRLVELAQLPTITLQVVPQSAGLHGGLRTSISLLSFADDEPDIAFTPTLTGVAETQDPADLIHIKRTIDSLAAQAMTPRISTVFIKDML